MIRTIKNYILAFIGRLINYRYLFRLNKMTDIVQNRSNLSEAIEKRSVIKLVGSNLIDIWQKFDSMPDKYREYAGSVNLWDFMFVGDERGICLHAFYEIYLNKHKNTLWHSHPSRRWWRKPYFEKHVNWLSVGDIAFATGGFKMKVTYLLTKYGVFQFEFTKKVNQKKLMKVMNSRHPGEASKICKKFGVKRRVLADRRELKSAIYE